MTFTISVVAVWRTVQGGGPFNAATAGGTLFAVACYLGVVAIAGLLLAAAVTGERETATDALRRRDEQLRVALDAARMGVWFWSAADNRLTWDDTLRRMYGVGPDERIAGLRGFHRPGPPRRPGVRRGHGSPRAGRRRPPRLRVSHPAARRPGPLDRRPGARRSGGERGTGRDDRRVHGRDRPPHRRRAAPPGPPHGVGGSPGRRGGARSEQPDERGDRRGALHPGAARHPDRPCGPTRSTSARPPSAPPP